MPRGLIVLIIILILLVGGLFLLSKSADEVPVQNIEGNVTANAATN
jgi:type II secretory pathway pseudopilin PulG